jgi:G:T-mismatch repair DNA endonuclease (very short patch repair protein)
MLETEIKYELLINNIKLLKKIIKNRNSYTLLLEDGSLIKRKDIVDINAVCDMCTSNTKLKNIPEQYILEKNTYLCNSCRKKGENSPLFGRKWTDERKLERSVKYSGNGNPMFGISVYDKWVEKYGEEDANKKDIIFRNKQRILSSGENNPMFGISFYDKWVEKYGKEEANRKLKIKSEKNRIWLENNPDHLFKMITNSHNVGHKKTSIERKVEDYLIKNKIKHKYNFIIDKYQFDFILPEMNIIIETHGDYWHANPNIYSNIDNDKKSLNERQLYKVKRDIEKLSYINNNTDYKIIYLWETEINNNEYKKILNKWNL